ncbi:unnamed protein product [Closterium sp. Naga37s-1]|nr:unnamed protein product [Closterium sp. Naga37s-1]
MLSIFRDPGSVPAHYVPDAEGDAEINAEAGRLTPVLVEVKRKGGEARYCQKCGAYKPARCHHCRICKRCVLRMDHHCVWINNCVGHANYKAFFLFVLYDVIALTHTVALLIAFFISSCLPLLIALVVLLVWHCYLIAINKTTIEHYKSVRVPVHYEGVRARLVSPRPVVPSQPPPSHPYDLGIIANLSAVSTRKPSPSASSHPYDLGIIANRSILGPEALCWLCPNDTRHISDGLHFDTAYSISRRSQLSLDHHTGHLDHVDRLL